VSPQRLDRVDVEREVASWKPGALPAELTPPGAGKCRRGSAGLFGLVEFLVELEILEIYELLADLRQDVAWVVGAHREGLSAPAGMLCIPRPRPATPGGKGEI
jgi:hypothetical protein